MKFEDIFEMLIFCLFFVLMLYFANKLILTAKTKLNKKRVKYNVGDKVSYKGGVYIFGCYIGECEVQIMSKRGVRFQVPEKHIRIWRRDI